MDANTTGSSAAKSELPGRQPLSTFLDELKKNPSTFNLQKRLKVIDQAIALLEEAYVHLPQKRLMYGVDAPQRLKVLRHSVELGELGDDLDFHREMLEIFCQLRDLHTVYLLPPPYNETVAILPFFMEEYFEEEKASEKTGAHTVEETKLRKKMNPHYVVTWVDEGTNPKPDLPVGAEIVHWNGVPIQRAIRMNGDREAGGNPAARYQRGLASMTTRPLRTTMPPDEEYVTVGYREPGQSEGEEKSAKLTWEVYKQSLGEGAEPRGVGNIRVGNWSTFGFDKFEWKTSNAVGAKAEDSIGLRQWAGFNLFSFDSHGAIIQKTRKDRMAGDRIHPKTGPEQSSSKRVPDFAFDEKFQYIFRAGYRDKDGNAQPDPQGNFGYIRIFTFMYENTREFVDKFRNLLGKMKGTSGLIIDVRGNGGGSIQASESLLQMISQSNVKIEPTGFQFVNSRLTRELCGFYRDLEKWESSISRSVTIGGAQSLPFPISSKESCNFVGRVYEGPVVLIVDARSYSATDIFAASFQDHKIGKVIGTGESTGAGGANVWTHSFLCRLSSWLPEESSVHDLFKPLPDGIEMRVAIRRCLRGRDNAGIPIEDLGVKPDEPYYMTKADLMEENKGLLAFAAGLLKPM